VEDPQFAAALRAALEAAMENGSLVIEKTRWLHQPWWRRLRIWMAYGLARLVIGLVGLGGRF